MSSAAYIKKVKVSTDQTTWLEVPTTSPSLSLGNEILDDTTLANNAGYRNKIYGLLGWSVNCDSNYEGTNAALNAINNALLTRTDLYVQYLPTGVTANGFQGKVLVEKYDTSGDVSSVTTVSISLQGSGAIIKTT